MYFSLRFFEIWFKSLRLTRVLRIIFSINLFIYSKLFLILSNRIGWHHEALTGRAKLLRSWDKRDSEAAQLESAADKLWEGQALSAEQRERLCALILPPIDIPKTLWGGDE